MTEETKNERAPKDKKWLEARKPYFIENGYCLFRYDDMNWAVSKWKDELVAKRMSFFGNIENAARKFIEQAYIKGSEYTSLKELLKDLNSRTEELLNHTLKQK